jgi:hypothetical protein
MADGSRSSQVTERHAAWVSWLIPSIADLLFVAILCLLMFTPLAVRLLGDAGIGWHIRTGELITATHAIPRVDSFSSTTRGKPWFAWEWSYDILVGVLHHAAGLNGVVWLTALVIAAVFAWTFRLLVSRGTNLLLALVLVLLAASASMIHFLARPHVVSWLFTLAWFWILDSFETAGLEKPSREKTRRRQSGRILLLLPVLMLVWVNVHGGFVIGFVLLAIYWAGAMWMWVWSREGELESLTRKLAAARQARRLALAGLLSILASLVNPYGWKLHVHIYEYLSNHFLMDHIQEFQSPNFHGVAEKCFAALLLIALIALACRVRESRQSHVLVILLAVYSGISSARSIPVSSLLLVLVIGPMLTRAAGGLKERRDFALWRMLRKSEQGLAGQPWAGPTFVSRMTAIELQLRGHLWPILAVFLTCGIALRGGMVGTTRLMDAHFDNKRFPARAVSFLGRSGIQDPVLTPDYWGGYLIYRLYPRLLVVADDRHDLYGEDFFKDYLKLMHGESGWQEFLGKYNVHSVLVPKDSTLASLLSVTAGWEVVYFPDDIAVLFLRSEANR